MNSKMRRMLLLILAGAVCLGLLFFIIHMQNGGISDEKLKVLGPSDLLRTFNKQRKRIIIKGTDLDHMIDAVRSVYDTFMRSTPEVGVVVDVNPLSLE